MVCRTRIKFWYKGVVQKGLVQSVFVQKKANKVILSKTTMKLIITTGHNLDRFNRFRYKKRKSLNDQFFIFGIKKLATFFLPNERFFYKQWMIFL